MASAFWKTPFGRSDLPPVQAFDFGSDPWGSDAALWIKSETAASPSDCAVLAIEQCGAEVWLYKNADGALLGFGAIAPSTWKIPAPNGPKISISLIPWMGLHRAFWGKGLGAENENKFSSLILDDLIDEARRHTERASYIGLFVDTRHQAGITVYRRSGFAEFPPDYVDKATSISYRRMLMKI